MNSERFPRRRREADAPPAPASPRALPGFAFDPYWQWATLLFLLVTTAFRLQQLPRMELAADEAYYWDWSRRLALGYYDQGPMIAYVIRLTTALFGTNEFGVRFGVLVASLGTLICCYVLAKRLFSPLTGFLTVLLLGATPLMEVGSIIATYDPLLVCFWAWTLVWLERALFAPTEQEQKRAWLLAGITTGLGFLSKHTMLLLLPCLLLFLALSPGHRFRLRRPEPYLAFALTLLLYSGVFWWNAQHHWWTFGHLLFLTTKTFNSPLRRFGDFLGSQALLLGPGLFVATLAACLRALKLAFSSSLKGLPDSGPDTEAGVTNKPTVPTPRPAKSSATEKPVGQASLPVRSKLRAVSLFLVCMGLPVFLFFCLLTMKAKVQGNWAPCAWLTPTILWAGWVTAWMGRSQQAARAATRTVGVVVALSLFLTTALISPSLRSALGVHLPPDADVSNTAYGWRQVAAHVQQMRREMEQGGKRKVFIASNGYQYAALMAFYLPDHPETHDLFLHFRLTMYAAHVERLKTRLGEDAIFVNDGEADDHDLRQIFERVSWDPPFPIWRRPYYKQPIRYMHIARCYHYRRYTGLEWAQGG